jgi:hypothetical protein
MAAGFGGLLRPSQGEASSAYFFDVPDAKK